MRRAILRARCGTAKRSAATTLFGKLRQATAKFLYSRIRAAAARCQHVSPLAGPDTLIRVDVRLRAELPIENGHVYADDGAQLASRRDAAAAGLLHAFSRLQ